MPFLIDGHNVIAALPDIDLADPHDEVKLVLKLRAWAGRVRRKAIVIFDGGIPGGPSRPLSTPDVRVIFAARQHTIADRIIRERVHQLPDAPNWTVVSSDREVLEQAQLAGARTLSAQAFADALERPPAEAQEKPETISAAEVAAWLEVFQEPTELPPPTPAPVVRPPQPYRQTPPSDARTPEQGRTRRTIGSQLGQEPASEAAPEAIPEIVPEEKPGELSEAEVDAWLDFFGGEPETPGVPPPQIQRVAASGKPPALKVKKTGASALTGHEVDAWLDFFGGEAQPPQSTQPAPPSQAVRKAGGKLAATKSKFAPVTTEASAAGDLSAEDRELWQRLFGGEP